METIRKLILGLRAVGFRAVFATIYASVLRDWDNLRFWGDKGKGKDQILKPGDLVKSRIKESGGYFNFENASLEVTFLTNDFVRLTWKPGEPPVPYAIAYTDWQRVGISSRQVSEGWLLTSNAMQLLVSGDGSVDFRDLQGNIIRTQEPPKQLNVGWETRAKLRQHEHIFGLGERAAPLNRLGGVYSMHNQDPGGSYGQGKDPLYTGIPVFIGVHNDGSYLLFYENSFYSTFTFSTDDFETIRFDGGMLRYYFAFGPVDRLLQNYSRLTGFSTLPPKWALGYHQSRWGYKSSSDVKEVVRGFKERNLPLSAIHLDIDYMDEYRVFTINHKRFPDLESLTEDLRRDDVRVVAILDVGVKTDTEYALYKDGLEKDVFCKLPNGKPVKGRVWPGWCNFPDFSSERVRNWWAHQYPLLLDKGISGFWHDMNEPSVFVAWGEPNLPLATRYSLEGRGGSHQGVNNLYGHLMNRAGYEGLKRFRPNRRPWIVSRSGWAGMQRFAWNWTGDIETSWAALRQTLSMMLGMGLSGVPFTGSDIGGFSGDPDSELFVRWFQLAAFTPFFRGHSAVGTKRREPWVYGEQITKIIKKYLKLRYKLLPYIYTAAWQASRYGFPLMRPLFWKAERNKKLLDIEDEYFFGDKLLVAPILNEGSRRRDVFLPDGKWVDFWTDRWFDGNQTINVDASLSTIPLFVQEGSVIAMETGQTMTIHLYVPGFDNEKEFESFLYSDSGDGYGEWRVDRFKVHCENGELTLAHEFEGDYQLPYDLIILKLHGARGIKAKINSHNIRIENNLIKLRKLEPVTFLIEPVDVYK